MKINFNAQGKARGKLANIIAEALNAECTYMKAPTYAYEIGAFTITREGELEFDIADISQDEIQTAVDAAKAAGFEVDEIDGEPTSTETQAEDGETAPETEGETEGDNCPETAAETEEGGDDGESPESVPQGDNEAELGENLLTISYPVEGFTLTNLNNLCQMIIAKKPLIQKALGINSVEIDYDEKEIRFPWFKAGFSSEDINAYAQFVTQLCKTALKKQRVTAQPKESYDSERFSMRVFMISLDMKGAEFDYARKLMMRNLEGSSTSPNADGVSKPRGERVEKQVLSVRFTPEMLDKIAELAGQSGMSRNALIESIVCEYVQTELPETTESETPDEESAE